MCTRNISPETVCCDCHPNREDVPGLGYSICPESGYLPDVLQPLIDDRDGRARVALLHEDPSGYDAEFYRHRLCLAAESVLASAGLRREGIEKQLAERVDGSISIF